MDLVYFTTLEILIVTTVHTNYKHLSEILVIKADQVVSMVLLWKNQEYLTRTWATLVKDQCVNHIPLQKNLRQDSLYTRH